MNECKYGYRYELSKSASVVRSGHHIIPVLRPCFPPARREAALLLKVLRQRDGGARGEARSCHLPRPRPCARGLRALLRSWRPRRSQRGSIMRRGLRLPRRKRLKVVRCVLQRALGEWHLASQHLEHHLAPGVLCASNVRKRPCRAFARRSGGSRRRGPLRPPSTCRECSTNSLDGSCTLRMSRGVRESMRRLSWGSCVLSTGIGGGRSVTCDTRAWRGGSRPARPLWFLPWLPLLP